MKLNDFEKKLAKKLSRSKVLIYDGIGSPCVILKDNIKHKRSQARHFLTSGVSYRSCLEKKKYAEILVKKHLPGFCLDELLGYSGNSNVRYVIIKDDNDIRFKVSLGSIKNGNMPTIRSCLDPEILISNSIERISEGKYSVIEFKYKNSDQIIDAVCKDHGEFKMRIRHFLCGHGCKECGMSGIRRHWNKGISHGYLYIMNIGSESESFIKVGITSNIKKRLLELKRSGYNVNVDCCFHSDFDSIWEAERGILTEMSNLSFKPKNKFSGHTECFSLSSKQKIYKFIKNKYNIEELDPQELI